MPTTDLSSEIILAGITFFTSGAYIGTWWKRLHEVGFIHMYSFAASMMLAFLPIPLVILTSLSIGAGSGMRLAGYILVIISLFIIKFPTEAWIGAIEIKERRRRNGLLIDSVELVTRHERVKGFHQKDNFGWVRTSGKENTERVEDALRLDAAKLGANALIKYEWKRDSETYTAGYGHKGNPYFKNKTVYSGEAVAVLVEKPAKPTHSKGTKKSLRKPAFKKYNGNLVLLDGNNIVGGSGWKFDSIINLLKELYQANYEYIAFFDNNIYRTLKENQYITNDQSISECLASIIGVRESHIVVTPKGEKADPYILECAFRKNAAVISNDTYEDLVSEHSWLENGERILRFKVVDQEVLVPKLSLLPKP